MGNQRATGGFTLRSEGHAPPDARKGGDIIDDYIL